MKILLIVSLFPPVRHIGAWRWGRLCRHLTSMGCEIQVITTTKGFWSSPHEDADPVPFVKVDRVDFPRNPVMAYVKLVQWGVGKFKGKGSATERVANDHKEVEVKKSVLARVKSCAGQILRGLSQLPQPIVDRLSFPHSSKYWSTEVIRHCEQNFSNSNFDVIVASHPYTGTLIAAKELSKLWGVPWVADFRDPWTHDHQGPFWNDPKKVRRMWQYEGETLDSASAVVSINRQMLEFLNASEEKKYVITNSYEPTDYTISWSGEGRRGDVLNLCYAGSIAEGYEYRLFLDGLKSFQDRGNGVIIFHYYGRDFQRLSSYAQDIGLQADYLKNHGMVSHQEANRSLAEFDCGVVFGWSGPMAKIVSTGKIFDSLGVKSPTLGICAISGSGMEDIILRSGIGRVLHSAHEIDEVLSEALDAKKRGKLKSVIAPLNSEEKSIAYTTMKLAGDYMVILNSLKT